MVARRAHNPKVVGSSPSSATKTKDTQKGVFFCFACENMVAYQRPRVPEGDVCERSRCEKKRAKRSSRNTTIGKQTTACADRVDVAMGRWHLSFLRNQQCEPKKMSVRKTQ